MHAMQSFAVSCAHLQPAGLVESPAILRTRTVLSLRLLRLGSPGSTDGRTAQQVLESRQGVGRSAMLLPAQHALAQAQRFSCVPASKRACSQAQECRAVQGRCDGAFCAGDRACTPTRLSSGSEAGGMRNSWGCWSLMGNCP